MIHEQAMTASSAAEYIENSRLPGGAPIRVMTQEEFNVFIHDQKPPYSNVCEGFYWIDKTPRSADNSKILFASVTKASEGIQCIMVTMPDTTKAFLPYVHVKQGLLGYKEASREAKVMASDGLSMKLPTLEELKSHFNSIYLKGHEREIRAGHYWVIESYNGPKNGSFVTAFEVRRNHLGMSYITSMIDSNDGHAWLVMIPTKVETESA